MERNTKQRSVIRRVIKESDRPLKPDEILSRGRRSLPRLGIATVYRAVREFVDDGVLKAVQLPGEPTRYELACLEHHHHFFCKVCGKVFEMQGCPPDLGRLAPEGFAVEGHEVTLYGKCASCK